ncbi:hypothetical protein [Paracoccus sp. S1E-3]|nr:hypothetical protein [Paracoccus sp. S1E-3]
MEIPRNSIDFDPNPVGACLTLNMALLLLYFVPLPSNRSRMRTACAV